MNSFRIELHRCNKDTNLCDDTGRKSTFYYSSSSLKMLKERVKNQFKEQLKFKPNFDFFDFDKDVYFVDITNLVTNKSYIIVK